MRYLLGHGLYDLHLESGGFNASSWLCLLGQPQEERTVVWVLNQPGERLCCVRLHYSCRVSQERIKVSAVPMAPQVFVQNLSFSLAYPGFSKQ